MKMRSLLSVLVLLALVSAVCCTYNFQAVQQFADAQWDCADVSCSQKVSQGSWQPNYECAEFVSRSLINGGFIPNISPYASQSELEYYSYNGQVYDLLWVSSKQGPPLGLQDLLVVLGWTETTECALPNAIMMTGSDGPYSHTGICIGNNLADAHNMAEYHQPPTGLGAPIDTIYQPPASATSSGSQSTAATSKTTSSKPASSSGSNTHSSNSGTQTSSSSSSSSSSSTGSSSTGSSGTGSSGTGSSGTQTSGSGTSGTQTSGSGSSSTNPSSGSNTYSSSYSGDTSGSGCVMKRAAKLTEPK